MSTKGDGDHSNHGCDSGKLLSCGLSTESSAYEPKSDTISLINDIAHDNSVCFNTSIQDGDHTDLFYNIVCNSDLPVGENISISSPQQTEASNMAFVDGVNSFPTVDVVVQGMDVPLDNLTMSVPDFKLSKNSDSPSDDLTIQMEEQQKKLNESISAIAKSLGLEDLIPETFNVDNKDIFSITVPSDSLEKEQSSPLTAMSDFKQPVETHLSHLPIQFTSESDILDCYDTLSVKKKCHKTESAPFMSVPVVMSDGSTGYVVCSKDNTEKKKSGILEYAGSNPFMNGSADNLCFQDLEVSDNEASDFVTMNDSIDDMTFSTEENDVAASNIVCAESIECVLQAETSESSTGKEVNELCDSMLDNDNIAISEVSDLLSKVLEQSPHTLGTEPATVSVTTDNASKKMQIILMTSQGQQVIEFDTDNLGIESVSSTSVDMQTGGNGLSSIKINGIRATPTIEQSIFPNEICKTFLDDVEDELTCEEDLVEFVKKITPIRGKRKSWICPVEGCGQILNKECKLRVHMINHKGARPYKCTVDDCDWAFTTPYRLRRHCETHVGKKDYICDYEGCGRKFTTVYNLNTHKKRHVWPNSLICPAEGCDMSFGNRRKLELHLRVHDDIEAPYSCSVCGKKYYSANCIASHYRTHQYSEDDFKCPFESCRKKYDKFCRLKQHIRHHTGERPYACPAAGCKWSFMSASKLTRHMRKHTGERKFVCTEPGCGKSFMRPEHLKGHVVIHSGDKPFQCPHENCNARFTAKSSLYVHVKKHCASGLKIVYPCPVTPCVKKYNNRASLKQHIQKIHPSFLQDGKLIEIPEKVELTVPVSISVADETKRNDSLSPVIATNPSSLKGVIRNVPAILRKSRSLNMNAIKVSKSTSSKLKESQKNSTIVVPNSNRSGILKSDRISGTELLSERLQHENCSGSARTDYCCNRITGASKKSWTLQNRAHLVMHSQGEESKNIENNSQYIVAPGQCSTAVRSSDVLLASSSVALQDCNSQQLEQTNFLQDDSSIYHEDSILVSNSKFSSELHLNSSLLLEDSDSNSSVLDHNSEAANFSTGGVDDFSVSAINLQCLE